MDKETPKSTLAMAVGVIALLVVGGYLLFKYKDEPKSTAEDSATLGEQVSSRTETPVDSVPNVNPYKTAETNPFEKANPLKDVYKNPFGD